MFTTIVTYKPANGKSAEEIIESFQEAAPFFGTIPGLIRKYFCFDEETMEGTSVYIWQDRASAEACFGNPAFLERFRTSFGCEPNIRHAETRLVVDNSTD